MGEQTKACEKWLLCLNSSPPVGSPPKGALLLGLKDQGTRGNFSGNQGGTHLDEPGRNAGCGDAADGIWMTDSFDDVAIDPEPYGVHQGHAIQGRGHPPVEALELGGKDTYGYTPIRVKPQSREEPLTPSSLTMVDRHWRVPLYLTTPSEMPWV